MKYHYIGIPTRNRLKDETYLEHLKIHVSGYGQNLYGIEWTRYDEDAPYPDLVKTVPHVAFEVENIQAVIAGKKIIIEPNCPSPGIIVAFIEDNGAPVEFLQIDRNITYEEI